MRSGLKQPVIGTSDIAELRSAIDTAPVGIIIADELGKILSANAAAGMLLPSGSEFSVGQEITDILPLNEVNAALDDGQVSIVHLGRGSGYGRVSIELRVARWQTKKGDGRYTLVLNDVTKFIRDEAALQQTLRRWDYALTGARIGVFEVDLISGDSVVSETWKTLMGLDPKMEVDAQAEWRSRIHPEDMPMVREADKACVEGKASRSITEYRLRKPHGLGWRWMRSDAIVAERDINGIAVRLVGAQTDITAEKSAAEALRVSIEQFKSAFDDAPIGKAIVGLDGSWLKVNAALCTLLGRTEDELTSSNFQSVTHPDDIEADLAEVEKLLGGEKSSYRIEKRFLRGDGAVIWGILSVAVVCNTNGKPAHFISQIVDVTEPRRLDHLKSEFIATVSHELRTPLTSILGALALIETTVSEELSDDANRLLFIAQKNSERLKQLVNDILDMERLKSQSLSYDLSVHRVVELLEECVLSNLQVADEFNIHFVLNSQERELRCQTDPHRFQQVMTNLMSNAAKFSDKGGTVELRSDCIDEKVRISVINQGVSIPEEFRSKLFRPFSQVAPSSTRKRGGSGLGLSISKELVEQMGGTIGYESTRDGRTTFWFTLPPASSRSDNPERA